MPEINPNAATVQVNYPVPSPVPRRPPAQPVPRAARPTLAPVPGGMDAMGVPQPELRALLIPWKPEVPRRQLRRERTVAKMAARRRQSSDYAGLIRHLHDHPDDRNAAGAFADWLEENGKPLASQIVRQNIRRVEEDNGASEPRVAWPRKLTSREAKGRWGGRFFVYAPQAAMGYGGDPYTNTSLTFQHPDDPRRGVTFGHFADEPQGAAYLVGLEREGFEPWHETAPQMHERFRTGRPELFPKPQQMSRLPRRRLV